MKKILSVLALLIFMSGCSSAGNKETAMPTPTEAVDPVSTLSPSPTVTIQAEIIPESATIPKGDPKLVFEMEVDYNFRQAAEMISIDNGYLVLFYNDDEASMEPSNLVVTKLDKSGKVLKQDIYKECFAWLSDKPLVVVGDSINIYGHLYGENKDRKWQLVYDLNGNFIQEKKESEIVYRPARWTYRKLKVNANTYVLGVTKADDGPPDTDAISIIKFDVHGTQLWKTPVRAKLPENEMIDYPKIIQANNGDIILYGIIVRYDEENYDGKEDYPVIAIYDSGGYLQKRITLDFNKEVAPGNINVIDNFDGKDKVYFEVEYEDRLSIVEYELSPSQYHELLVLDHLNTNQVNPVYDKLFYEQKDVIVAFNSERQDFEALWKGGQIGAIGSFIFDNRYYIFSEYDEKVKIVCYDFESKQYSKFHFDESWVFRNFFIEQDALNVILQTEDSMKVYQLNP